MKTKPNPPPERLPEKSEPRLITTDRMAFVLGDKETLLEALERTGHHVEYQCRSGYCGSCRLKLRSGSVSYPEPPMAFIGEDEILPCCCQVESSLHIRCALKKDRK